MWVGEQTREKKEREKRGEERRGERVVEFDIEVLIARMNKNAGSEEMRRTLNMVAR